MRACELSKDQYVEITDQDLDEITDEDPDQLPLPTRHRIELSAFVKSDETDPKHHEKSYYLEPEETGLEPCALLMTVLERKSVIGMATRAIRTRESRCAPRPSDASLVLETLRYPDETRPHGLSRPRAQPATSSAGHELSRPDVLVNARELALAGTLVDAPRERCDPARQRDHHRAALLERIVSKTRGLPGGRAPERRGGRAGGGPDSRAAGERRRRAEAQGWRRRATAAERKEERQTDDAEEERKPARPAKKPRSRKEAA